MNITIVPATSGDAKDMQEVFYKAWLVTYPNKEYGITVDDIEYFFKDAFTEETIRDRAEKLANPPANMKMFVAKQEGKVVGLCRIILHPDKNQFQAIYILPEYQGKGIGKLLWNEALKIFDNTKETIVHVAVYNAKAIKFYEGLGFKDSGLRFSNERFRMKSGSIIPEMEMVIKSNQLK